MSLAGLISHSSMPLSTTTLNFVAFYYCIRIIPVDLCCVLIGC